MMETLGDDMSFTLQKCTDRIPRFKPCIPLTKPSASCPRALPTRAMGKLHTSNVSGNKKEQVFVVFKILPYFLDFLNYLAIS